MNNVIKYILNFGKISSLFPQNFFLIITKYLYRKSSVFLWFSKSVGFALQNSRFYLAKPTLLQCQTIGFGGLKRSCWLSVCYVWCAKAVVCNDFSQCFQVCFCLIAVAKRGNVSGKNEVISF